MNPMFAMWRKSLTQLIRMEDKKEWDGLSDLAALVLHGLLRPQPRVQQLLCNCIDR